MIDVYLTRHGQTVWNVEVRMQGRGNSPLTENGISGARALRDTIRTIPFTKCYTSPMPRALHTALILIGDRSVPLDFEPALAEMDLGCWEGMRAEDARTAYPEEFHNFKKQPDLFVPVSGGETFSDVVRRAGVFLKKLEELPDNSGPVLAVTHCILLQAIMMICDGRGPATLRSGQEVDQTTLFHIRWDHGKWSVLARNEPTCYADILSRDDRYKRAFS